MAEYGLYILEGRRGGVVQYRMGQVRRGRTERELMKCKMFGWQGTELVVSEYEPGR